MQSVLGWTFKVGIRLVDGGLEQTHTASFEILSAVHTMASTAAPATYEVPAGFATPADTSTAQALVSKYGLPAGLEIQVAIIGANLGTVVTRSMTILDAAKDNIGAQTYSFSDLAVTSMKLRSCFEDD